MNRLTLFSICLSPVILAVPCVAGGAEAKSKTPAIKAETPQALMAVRNRAVSQKDWRICYLCDDPELRGDFFHYAVFGAAVGKDADLGAILGKWLKLDAARPDGNFPNIREDDRVPDGVLWYEAFQKRVDDLPGFAADVARRLDARGAPPFRRIPDLHEIKTKGDWAMGYELPARDAPPAAAGGKPSAIPPGDSARGRPNAPQTVNEDDEPEIRWCRPVHFRKIDGNWCFARCAPPLSPARGAKVLKKEVKSLFITLSCNNQGIPPHRYLELRFLVKPWDFSSDHETRFVQLTEQQAQRLIDYLGTEGYLRQAVELSKQKIPQVDLTGTWYTLQVSTGNLNFCLHEDLGWGPGMLKRLQGMRTALEGDAAEAMDELLGRLAEDQKKWKAEAQGQHKPKSPPKEADR